MTTDYVIKIVDTPAFISELRTEAENGSPYAYIDEGDDDARLNLAVTGKIAKVGTSTVSIYRLNEAEHIWLTGIPQVQELGSAPVIKEMDDITWITSGKGFYHAIHAQTPYDVDDGEGGTITITPPLLHCILASE